mgnify:CR=1 FL=1|jgi:hypothetical protein
MNNFNYKRLPPFKWFILENFPFIEADFDALTEWQLLCKLGNELSKVVNATNTLGTQVETLTDYVSNYFDNLDVQEEINNKLDEMAESGELTDIIAQYLELAGILAFNTVSNMANAQNLANGSFARTFGKNLYNDGLGAYYKIRGVLNTDVIDGDNIVALTNYPNLIAEKIIEKNIIIDVSKYGIKNDGTDMSTQLQALFTAMPEGTTFQFDNGTYYIKNIEPKSHTTILGNNTKFIIPTNDEIASIFVINEKENIKFKNCYFQNGEEIEGSELHGDATTNFKACVLLQDSLYINFENCIFNEFYFGIHAFDSSYINIDKCNFKKSGYNMIMIINDSKYWNVTNCNFENAYDTSTSNSNTYMICTTSTPYDSTDFPEYINILNCNFKNNESWTAIDSHGANYIRVENCNFENIKYNMDLFNDQRFSIRDLHMHDIIIKNNNIKSTIDSGLGINISGIGEGDGNEYLLKNVIIENNIINIGNSTAIKLSHCQNITISNNKIDSQSYNIYLIKCVFGNVSFNEIFAPTSLLFVFTNCHLLDILYNKIETLINVNQPITVTALSNIYFEGNTANYSETLVRNNSNVRYFRTFGKPVIDFTTMRNTSEIVTSKNVSTSRSVNVTAGFTVSGTSGETILVSNKNILEYISVFQRLSINNTEYVVTEYLDKTHFKVDRALSSNLTDASVILLPYSHS